MTRKLEEIFQLPSSSEDAEIQVPEVKNMTAEETRELIHRIDDTRDRVDAALPTIRDLERSDQEIDEIASKASTAGDDLMTLGYNVDSRFSSEIFQAAKGMYDTALHAKVAKMNKKLKTIELQMKKMKLDSDLKKAAQAGKIGEDDDIPTAEGHILSRNELLEIMLGKRDKGDDDDESQ